MKKILCLNKISPKGTEPSKNATTNSPIATRISICLFPSSLERKTACARYERAHAEVVHIIRGRSPPRKTRG